MTAPPGRYVDSLLWDRPTHIQPPFPYAPWKPQGHPNRNYYHDWSVAHGGDKIPLFNKQVGGISTAEAVAVREILACFRCPRSGVNLVKKSLQQDPMRVDGFTTNLTRSWQMERAAAYAGTSEARRGLVWSNYAIAGAGKTIAAIILAWWDHLAKLRTGFYKRLGTPREWRKFSLRNIISDTIAWQREKGKRPPGAVFLLDDSLRTEDAENGDLRQTAVEQFAESCGKQRDPGITGIITDVAEAPIDEKLLTDKAWIYPDLRVDGYFGHIVRQARGMANQFSSTGYLLVAFPGIEIRGPAAAYDGALLLRLLREQKQAAHQSLYGGIGKAWRREDLASVLQADPVEAVRNCFTHAWRFAFLSEILSEQWSYSTESVITSENLWLRGFEYYGYEVGTGEKRVKNLTLNGVEVLKAGEEVSEEMAGDVVARVCEWLNKRSLKRADALLSRGVA